MSKLIRKFICWLFPEIRESLSIMKDEYKAQAKMSEALLKTVEEQYQTCRQAQELSKKPKQEIQYALLSLMLQGKINFTDLNEAYVKSLNIIKEDRLNQLIEAETCVLESFMCKKGNKQERDMKHTQRCLYLLNQSKRFNIDDLNKKYEYNEEKAKEYSYYERNKKDK